MEAGSDGEINKNMNQSSAEGSKRPKRQMKTPFQLEVLEKTYAMETYPSEATRAELSQKLDLTDRQLQMWFCHRRLKDKKEAVSMAAMKPRTSGSVGRKGLTDSPREELMTAEPASGHGSGPASASASGSGSGSGSSEFDNGDDTPMVPMRYYDSPRTIMERRVIACVEAQLGEPLREDGPILGVEFDELPPGAFGAPIVPAEQQDRYRHSYDSKLYGQYDAKHIKAASNGPHEAVESKTRTDVYGHVAQSSYLYDPPVDGPTPKSLSVMHVNGHLPREHGVEGQPSSMDVYSQHGRQMHFSSPPRNTEFITHNNDNLHMERKRKSDEARIGREVQAHEKRIRKELEKQDLLRRKREDQMRKEMERQDRERRKEEQRILREQQRLEEKFQREERREMERREKFMQKELLRAEKRKQKEERRREKEAARQKAAMERATARRIAKESMELIEDERLELMELAASSKGLPSILSLDYDTLQNLESFREALCEFPPKSVQLRMPFAIKPWIDSEENVGNLLMVWKFCLTFADVLGLWPFTLDEFVQAFHDYDSRLLGEIHVALLKLIVKDIEDVVRTPSGGPGTNQYSAVNPEGGHPHIVEGAYLWGFDIRNWQKHLNPLTWPEILRQFALSAGFGPQLKKKGVDRVSTSDESKGCEEIVSTLRNGSAAENAVAIMQEKGFPLQRRSRHRLTPGTVKFAAYHVLALEGSKGLNVIELAEKIQKSGLRDLTTSKTPEASISVALSRDPILFERIAPSTYCVRPAFRKDPADAESIIAAAKEKIQRYANGFLAGQNADDEERDDDSDSDVPEGTDVDALAIPLDANKNGECNEVSSCPGDGTDKLTGDAALQNGIGSVDIGEGNADQGVEIDESQSGECWVQGLTEGDYSDLSVEERLNALVALIGVANEGNSIRVILEERMDAANALKKQMWAEAQLDKRRMREEIITKLYDSSANAALEGGLSPLVAENKIYDQSTTTLGKDDSSVVAEDIPNSIDNPAQDTSMGQFISPAQQTGHMTERSRLQLKSYIGHRAEELYVYRSLPLGQDRRRNRYWQFVASASCQDPGSGRIFVELSSGHWRLIDSEEAFDALLTSLDTRGTRESHLHIMLQKIEGCFKECVKRNRLSPNILGHNRKKGGQEAVEGSSSFANVESPSSAICSTNSDISEPSLSFRVDIGRNEIEKKNSLKRYEDFQTWMWKECFNSSIVCAIAYGKKRCLPLLEICNTCHATYDAKKDICPSCHRIPGKVGGKGFFPEQFNGEDIMMADSSPLRIRSIKAILALLEAAVPSEALHSSWTEDLRKTWGLELQKSSSIEDLLQILTQFEGTIKRDFLSADFETTEELLCYCDSSRVAATEFSGSVRHLPWIPKTTTAVALRLLELDASIFYTPKQKAESHDEKKMEALPKITLRCGNTKGIHKAESMEFDRHGSIKDENWDNRHETPGSSGHRQVGRGRGGGRPRRKSRKGVVGSTSQSSKRSMKQGESLAQILLQQGVRTPGEKHVRGRRTVRKRRMEKKIVSDTLQDYVSDKDTYKNVMEEPGSSGREEMRNFSTIVAENDDSSNSVEAGDSDDNDNANENEYHYEKWGATSYDAVSNRGNEMMEMSEEECEEEADEIDDENAYDEEDSENLEGDMEINDDELDREEEGNRDDEGSDSMVSGDYSD
ncbi:Transcription factor PHOX2/ARIX, contains HOX domain [Handroanthus impetiginosus]|uniref:Transcription factor PHOX2/ARIX, contains HOX domain n=1 Tax=Handroanthus impetiginosus TaxID=429701 RepID=A0A2G9GMV7_9LAMI|nr:Transcription factor PHOX2/ARIX, contains HOX domain [Handroanthus impetiginosus]